jgi:diaminopimelate epimerase
MAQPDDDRLTLSKHEGAGNDFLVVVDPDGRVHLDAGTVRALCDRHRGVGADGVIVVGPGRDGADLSMLLCNADGGEAAMSGNGIRCLAQAAVDAGLATGPRLTVATAAGVRTVTYAPGERPGEATASVDMGPVQLGPDQPQRFPDRRVREVDVGNPHLVLYGPDDPAEVAVAELGPRLGASRAGGVNVEFVTSGPAPGELVLRVWERGVGETRACGTGSCAAAAAARSWGLAGDVVRVHNPGGTLEVTLGRTEDDPVLLAGPVRRVAEVRVDLGTLDPGLLEPSGTA